MKRTLILAALAATAMLAGCHNAADVASYNLSQDADNFRINRHIVFYNGTTNSEMLAIDGLCSLGNADKSGELSVTCMTGPNQYKKHFLGLARDVTYFVQQVDPAPEGVYHYAVTFAPSTIVPDIRVR